MTLELWTLSVRIERRAAACGSKRLRLIKKKAESFLKGDEDGSLESLLNRFCRYARNTEERLVAARQGHDRETLLLLDRILFTATASIWFLDVYLNAVWLRCRLSALPKWETRFCTSTNRQLSQGRVTTLANWRTNFGVIGGS